MKNRNLTKLVLSLALISTIFMFSCGTTTPKMKENNANGKLKINSVTWIIENLEPSIWNGSPKGKSQMFISFYISYSGAFDTSVIKNIIVESPIDYWNLSASDVKQVLEIQSNKNIAIVKRLQCGDGLGAVPLGSWTFTLNEKSGAKYKQALNIQGFVKGAETNAKSDAPIDAVKQEKENTTVKTIVTKSRNKDEISALTRPVIHSVSRDENSIEIYFTANDNRIKNAYIWFDVPGEKYYKDSGSMIDASGTPVNGCRKFTTDGKKSRYILRKDADNAEWFDKITDCFVVVSDTNRVSSPWEERNRSVSAKASVK